MSENKTRIKIRIGSFEFEIEGKEDYINTIIGDDITEFIEKIKPFITEYLITPAVESKKDDQIQDLTDSVTDTEVPQITDAKGLIDGIRKLFSTNCGKTPHSISEINTILELNALHYEITTIGSTLTKMIKQGEIRRIGSKGNYQYISK